LKIFEQTLILFFQPDPDLKIFIAITIAIEKLIRIDRYPVFYSFAGTTLPMITSTVT
jgi:hypothetical protein